MFLVHLLFGNGRGLKSPYWDDVYYWLSGRLYHQSGWLGAQLQSFEWRRPPAGTKRRLAGRDFVIFSTERRFFIVRCIWAMPGTQTNESVRALIEDLKKTGETICR